MYRPRRTSEFHDDGRDDGGVVNKRQTRSLLRNTASSSISKPNHRDWQPQSRLTQYNQDRDRGTPLRTGPPPTIKRSLANGNAVTPLRHRQASSSERPVVFHTDKKWVQEQAQMIAEYLDEMVQTYALPNFPSDFFSRGAAALRQMTMKQFVGIVNFLLHFIWPNRTTVGSNHVEDITNALHKLNYPYQVNKSWLMTPTTQHSFGHVIVMLDFLKDFAPPSQQKQQESGQYEEFPFMETSEQASYVQNTQDSMALSNTQMGSVILNEETTQLLFTKSAECFAVWDKQKVDEYAVLKRNVSDRIVKSICDLPDTAALEADIVRQQTELQKLEEQLQKPRNGNSEHLEQLTAQHQQLEHKLHTMQANTQEYREKIERLKATVAQNVDTVKALRKHRQQLHRELGQQKCSAEQFQAKKAVLGDLETKEKFYNRQLREFTERGYDQQVRFSRAKKQLLDKVEKFNTHAQNIGLDSDICSASEKDKLDLVLSLPLQLGDIQARNRRLTKLSTMLEQRGEQHKERLRCLEQYITELTKQIRNIDGANKQLNTQIQSYEQQMEQLRHSHQEREAMWAQQQHQLEERKCELNAKLEQLQLEQHDLTEQLDNMRKENEALLSNAEQRHAEIISEREEFCRQYKQQLDDGEEHLKKVDAIIAQNDIRIASIEKQLKDSKLAPFEDVLDNMFKNLIIN
ncbi:hypothetical protein AWZ03_009783 [Drosophila navojoa]|uniref:Kinetochore protein NDC80 n=1 Tax=Drosophila navojoa TaxID=7232 RepID=A0A484B7H9_DRONA|nr:kinetochore protein NDC80 homolog [Drosophila navojoa]TDG43801.1 hypothetical protein AWZ03_009783 [Drosophila navojoa]